MGNQKQNAVDIWNLRDEAFLENIQHTLAFLQRRQNERPAHVAIWTHNSHAGDICPRTVRVSNGYKTYNNLRHLSSQAFGGESIYSIGMLTYNGSVRASKEWGSPDQVMELAPAFEGSHEYLLHTIAKSCRRENGVGIDMNTDSNNSNSKHSSDATAAQELFGMDRVERFVGVSYAPQTELQSHYNVCNLHLQFDFVIHVDRSTALRVDSAEKRNGKTMKDSSVSSSPWDRMLLDKYGFDIIYKDLFDSPVDTATSVSNRI